MLASLLAHLLLLTFAVVRRNGGQAVAALVLLMNWALCSSFIYATDCHFPWPWYITVDWLSALILWIDRESKWQRALVATYAVELLMHAAFAYVTQGVDASNWSLTDKVVYWHQRYYDEALSLVEWAQLLLMWTWIAHDIARDWASRRSRLSPPMAASEQES